MSLCRRGCAQKVSRVFSYAMIAAGLFVSVGIPAFARAQEGDTDEWGVAGPASRIGIRNAVISNQAERSVSVSFDVLNEGSDIQTDLRFALEILSASESGSVIDRLVSDESVVLGSGAHSEKTLHYDAAPGMSGRYFVRIVAGTSTGAGLGSLDVGTVDFTSSGIEQVVLDPESCFLTVGDEPIRYDIRQGTDVGSSETLRLHCQITNHGGAISVSPEYSTRRWSAFASVLDEFPVEEVVLPSGLSEILLPVPPKSEPGVYYVRETLMSKGVEVASPISFRYFVQGVAPSISSVRVDPSSSESGSLKLFFSVSGNPDQYLGSRSGDRPFSGGSVKAASLGSGGSDCSVAVSVPISTLDRYGNVFSGPIDLPVRAGCSAEAVVLTVSDNGREYFSTGRLPIVPGTYGASAEETAFSGDGSENGLPSWVSPQVVIVSILALLVLILVGVLGFLRMRPVRGGRRLTVVFLLASIFGTFGLVSPVFGAGVSLETWVANDHVDRWNLHESVSAPVGQWTPTVGDDGNRTGTDDQAFAVRGMVYGPDGGTLSLESWVADDHVDRWNLHESVSAPTNQWTPTIGDDGDSPESDDQAFSIRAKLDDNAERNYSSCILSLETWVANDHVDRWNLHESVSAPVGQWTPTVGDDGNRTGTDDQAFSIRMKLDCPNTPPGVPTVTGPAVGLVGTAYSFTATASDPSGDMVRYGFDWNGDYSVDQWTPFVSSGMPQSLGYAWSFAGMQTYRVIAQDAGGAVSDWGSGRIDVGVDGRCGYAEVVSLTSPPPNASLPTLCASGIPTAVTTRSSGWFWSCIGTGAGATADTCWASRYCAPPDCASRSDQVCKGDTFTMVDGCGVNQTCNGSKVCSLNWREVPPGE
ncbi:MAG: hypothetical protein HGA38_05040 [Candidatus Moranbacteria bacterium]|nr:hypothetical protein [Candidatus Moranbacteria bacterium]